MKLSYTSTYKALAWYASILNNQIKVDFLYTATILKWIDGFCSTFEKRLKQNGKKWTLNRYKSIYNWFKGFLYKTENYQTLLDPFIATNHMGWPREISVLCTFILEVNPIWLRVVMTVLRLYESIELPVEFDSKPIEEPYKGKPLQDISDHFQEFLEMWFEKFGSKFSDLRDVKNLVAHTLRFSFKSGPMGSCILSAHLCGLAILTNKVYLKIYMAYCISTGNLSLLNTLYELNDNCQLSQADENKLITGRIALTPEGGGKTRLFAICNFWVQSAFKPLHDTLMKALKLFPADGTYDQVGQYNKLIQSCKGQMVYCFDLSKATDRFPVKLQIAMLSVFFRNSEIANLWSHLIGGFPFSFKSKTYTWMVGQPLGALSSWATFALTHHLVIQYCAFLEYKFVFWFSKYSLLGDDIAIWDKKVAIRYMSFMTDIGVEINHTKSVIGVHSGEFAKRNFLNGINISGFGFKLIRDASATPANWVRFLEILISEQFYSDDSPLLFPVIDEKELSWSYRRQLIWAWTIRQAFAQKLILTDGNRVFSYKDLMEHYVLQRIFLLCNQTNSSLSRKQYLRVTSKIQEISKCWGVEVKENFLDVSFVNNELVGHPLVRYLVERNNLIYDKIITYNEVLRGGIFDQESILSFTSYAQEEYIPSFKLDTFFTKDLNQLRNTLKTSTLHKSISTLMKG